MNVYLFPGQGAQQKGMGEELFDEFEDLVEKADKILGYSVRQLCLEDEGGKLKLTQFTQPAIFVVNALSCIKKMRDGIRPDFVAGHSVGEYNALLASGVIDFETGVKLVKKRSELMSQAKGGGMAAVLGIDQDRVRGILEENDLSDKLFIANYNSTYQSVISGLKEDVEKAEPLFTDGGAKHYRILNVSGAFHTPYMEKAKKKFMRFAKKFDFGPIGIPIISNVTARPYRQEDILNNIVEQITAPVGWCESIRYLLAMGCKAQDFVEISGGSLSVVKALAIRIQHEAGPLDLETEKEPVAEVVAETKSNGKTRGEFLGNEDFKRDYNLKYPYLGGGMYKGIASKEMVARLGKAGMMGFLGTGGLELTDVEASIDYLRRQLPNGEPWGVNLVSNAADPSEEKRVVDVLLKHHVNVIEAAAFMTVTPALVEYKARGLANGGNGNGAGNRIIAKVSRPEVAQMFLSPAPERVVNKLVDAGVLQRDEAEKLRQIPVADDLVVEADSGGHTDMGVAYTLMPAMAALRDELKKKHGYNQNVRIGAAGGIGTPQAAAAAFVLGADFILTGSINQCSVEAGTSETVKDMLQGIDVQDTDYAPAGDMFELGAKVQVLRKGVFFPARANKLFDLYRRYNSLEELDTKTRSQLQEKYFKRSFDDIFSECRSFYPAREIQRAEQNPKHKMAMIFKWYFGYSTRLALEGDPEEKVNYQVQCGSSLGAFNRWVKGTGLEDWRNRHVDHMGARLLDETADLLGRRLDSITRTLPSR